MTNKLDVYRAGAIISSFDIDSSTVFNEKLQGTRLISCPVSTVENIDIQEEDYIIFEDEEFSVNLMSDKEKDGAVLSQKISVNFEAAFYKLLDVYVKSSLGAKKFPFYGTALEHCQMIINSANQVGSGWFLIEVDNTDPVTIEYDFTYVRTALDIISEATGLEWDVKGKGLKMVESIGRDTGLVFELGRGKGLHQIKRSPDASKNVITRAYGQGGSRNIASKYRGGLYNNLIFEGEFVQTPGVTAGTQRVKEGRYINEKIFPQFKGTITATTVLRGADNKIISTSITDTSIDFNINDHLQEGVKAKVSFLTGVLGGNEFEIEKYVHATRTITLINSTDANGYIRPNDLNLPEVGNKFTLLDMNMPVEYVTSAENELKTETQAFLNENEFQRLLYGAKPDPKVLRESNIRLRAGDRATVKDTSWKVNEVLRFTEITFPLVNRFDVTAIVGNEIRYDKTVKLIADVLQANKQVQDIDRKSEILAKRGVQNLRAFEISVFNPDGKLNADRYDVGVLTTLLAIIGTKSQNFRLNKVYITDNFGGNANSVSISLGELVHFEYANPSNKNIWQLQQVVQSGLIPDKLYYVYCKCSKNNQSGTFVITIEQIKPEDIDGFWMFLAGVIYPVLDGYRNSDFTNGIADITAARIKIGKIVSRDGLTGFDLDNSTIFGKITFRSSNGTTKNVADVDLTANSALVQAGDAKGTANAAQNAANNAKVQADAVLAKINDITNDNILSASEKPEFSEKWQAIKNGHTISITQANTFNVSSTDVQFWYNVLNGYVPGLIANMNVDTAIDGQGVRSNFLSYYSAREVLLKGVTDAANAKIDGIQVGGRNLLRNYDNIILSGTDYPGASSVTKMPGEFFRLVILRTGAFNNYSFLGSSLTVPMVSGIQYCVSIVYKNINPNVSQIGVKFVVVQAGVVVGTTDFMPGTGSAYRTASVVITSNSINELGLVLSGSGDAGNQIEYTGIQIEYGNKPTSVAPGPEDAFAFADTIATTKANAAQANALYGASQDAQNKANNAYNTAVASSNTYANTVSNSAASAAQVAASADASNKAQQAYNDATAAANAKYNNLTGQLKTMAYRDITMAAAQGVTTIDNGSVVTFSVDAAYVRANVINVGYITGLDLNFTKGTIGGILIQNNAISSSNGLFSVTNAGLLTAANANISGTVNSANGNIGGFSINNDGFTKGQLNTPGNNYVKIAPGSFRYQTSWQGGGGSNIEFNGFNTPGQYWAASIGNGRIHDELNVALILGATGSSFRNIALQVSNGDIMAGTEIGGTFTQNIGGGYGLKFVKGICIGAVGV